MGKLFFSRLTGKLFLIFWKCAGWQRERGKKSRARTTAAGMRSSFWVRETVQTGSCPCFARLCGANKPFPSRRDASSSARTCLLRLSNHKPYTFATHFAGHNVLISCGWRIPTYSALAEKAHEKMHAQGLQGCAMAATDSASNQPRLQNFQALQTCLEEEMRGRVPAPRWTW
jgi:hypothetical protein